MAVKVYLFRKCIFLQKNIFANIFYKKKFCTFFYKKKACWKKKSLKKKVKKGIVDSSHLNKRMRSKVSPWSISGANIIGIVHYVKGCLEDNFPDNIILRHDTNDLESNNTSEGIAYKMLNLAVSVKTNENKFLFLT